jgi:DNA-binding PadR family transcriptional regulator
MPDTTTRTDSTDGRRAVRPGRRTGYTLTAAGHAVVAAGWAAVGPVRHARARASYVVTPEGLAALEAARAADAESAPDVAALSTTDPE